MGIAKLEFTLRTEMRARAYTLSLVVVAAALLKDPMGNRKCTSDVSEMYHVRFCPQITSPKHTSQRFYIQCQTLLQSLAQVFFQKDWVDFSSRVLEFLELRFDFGGCLERFWAEIPGIP